MELRKETSVWYYTDEGIFDMNTSKNIQEIYAKFGKN